MFPQGEVQSMPCETVSELSTECIAICLVRRVLHPLRVRSMPGRVRSEVPTRVRSKPCEAVDSVPT